MEFIAQIIFVAGFIFAFFIDHIPLSLRVVGFKLAAFPTSTLRSQQVMILNRFGFALYLTSAGFLVDKGISPQGFLELFSLALALVGFLSLLYVRSWVAISRLITFYVFGHKNNILNPKVINFTLKNILTNYPFMLNVLGASIPVMSASVYPEFRGMLLQIGFLFNTTATLLLVFWIEPKFIKHFTNNDSSAADEYHQRLISSKALLLISMGCISWLIVYLM